MFLLDLPGQIVSGLLPSSLKQVSDKEDPEILLEEDERLNIPNHFALKSIYNHRYLRYVNEDGLLHEFLQYSGEAVMSPLTKFQAENSKTRKGLVHIRCSYNNKYWARQSSDSNFIVAVAHEAEEDTSKWSCTLFQPIIDTDDNGLRFCHVQLNHNMFITRSSYPHSCLMASPDNADEYVYASSTVVDWDSIFVLPKHVAFKGDNDKYLKVDGSDLQFSGTSLDDASVAFETFTTNDGNVRIKSDESRWFWTRESSKWIKAASTDNESENPDTLFWPVAVDKNVVALRNLGNNLFCKRHTGEGKTNGLNARVETITEEAHMEVAELVVSRTIENIQYRTADARIYGQKVLTTTLGDAINRTSETDTITFKFSYENKDKKEWNSSISAAFGISVEFKAGFPFIGETGVDISFEIGGGHKWGETEKNKELVEVVKVVTVPPMSKVKMSAIIKQGSCDVPFSYTQRDILKTGKRVVHHLDDGIFSGVNSYDFDFVTKHEKL